MENTFLDFEFCGTCVKLKLKKKKGRQFNSPAYRMKLS